MPEDKFQKIAINLGWHICKKCNTLVVNIDKSGNCNPPCRPVNLSKKNKKIYK